MKLRLYSKADLCYGKSELKPISEQKAENIFGSRHFAKPIVICFRSISEVKTTWKQDDQSELLSLGVAVHALKLNQGAE